ncbi:ankyrin repeat-containing domain protein [Aspergillus karnatakaensis]|uniref:ankyrin repeat domain-containing protein n=1 Tax=Aspergillus karnatakaensis TaxID=1810916 RepID=UPI003CCD61FF
MDWMVLQISSKSVMHVAPSNVHVTVLSRELNHIRDAFEGLNRVIMVFDKSAAELDIQTALRHQLLHDAKFSRWRPQLKQMIESSVLPRTYGSYRWMDCQLQSLRKCATPRAVQESLASLPSSLEEYYCRVLDRIDSTNQAVVRNLLRWVTLAFRPLTIVELLPAIAINTSSYIPYYDVMYELLDGDGFFDSCSSFVTVERSAKDLTKTYVKLAHYTVREFLLSEATRIGSSTYFHLEERESHAIIAKSALAYIHYIANLVPEHAWQYYTLTSYAKHFWHRHKVASGDEWDSSKMKGLLIDCFDGEGLPFALMGKANLERPWQGEALDKAEQYSPLYYAAHCGMEQVVQVLLATGADPNSGRHCPLQAAARNGNRRMVRALIESGANVDSHNALGAACQHGHHDVVVEPVNAGASINRTDIEGLVSYPLLWAVCYGHTEICRFLLARGAEDFHSWKGMSDSCLDAAVSRGYRDIVEELLQCQYSNPPDSRCYNPYTFKQAFDTAMKIAKASGDFEIFREILAHGTRFFAISVDEALELASSVGDEALICYLQSRGTDLCKQIDTSSPPAALGRAAQPGDIALARDVLSQGANANNRYGDDWTPLELAILGNNPELVPVLIDSGAQVNSRPPRHIHQTAHEALPEEAEGAGPTPLILAAKEGHVDIMALLLKAGADVNAQDAAGFSALHLAARRRTSEGLKLLLNQTGLDINARLFNGSLPLHSAASYGTAENVKLLVDAGPDINAVNQTGRSALHWAAHRGNWETIEVLLDLGASAIIESADIGANTALDMAHLANLSTDTSLVQNLPT